MLCLALVGCAAGAEGKTESEGLGDAEQSASQDELSEKAEHTRYSVQIKWQEGYRGYDPEDTIFYKTYYDDSGRERRIKYPEINMRDEMQGFASWGRKEFRLHDERYDAYIDFPQLSGMEDPEKEKRLNALIEADVMKVLEDGESDDEYRTSVGFDYEIKYIDDRIISILYKSWYGAVGTGSPAVAMATTIDVEEEGNELEENEAEKKDIGFR